MIERDTQERKDARSDGPREVVVRVPPASGDRSPSSRVVESVADAVGADPTEIRPLYEVLDPDALDRLAGSGSGGTGNRRCRVSFRYEGCDVTVEADGRTTVSPPDSDPV